MRDEKTGPSRIVSLDQYRGYTVLGMFFVNFASHFLVFPDVCRHHHTYCSYADTIMPQFFFAVGFAYRLTLRKRLETVGAWAAYTKVLRRGLGLILLGLVIHGIDGGARSWEELRQLGPGGFLQTGFQRKPFQTLTHIGITSLWVLPVIGARPIFRVAYAAASAVLFWYLSQRFYFAWEMKRPGIDGGPLGFLTWTTPLLVGSIAYDAFAANRERPPVLRFLAWGAALMLLGYGLSCLGRVEVSEAESWLVEPPFVQPSPPIDLKTMGQEPSNFWRMSQRAGSPSYHVFAAGFSLALYALFVLACDVGRLRLGLLETLGANALAAYIIHDLVGNTLGPFAPRDAPWWYAVAAFAVFCGVCYAFLRYLEKNRLYLRL
jgi:predicted acyltransferase